MAMIPILISNYALQWAVGKSDHDNTLLPSVSNSQRPFNPGAYGLKYVGALG